MPVRQAELRSGELRTVAWVDVECVDRVGVRAHGKEDGRWWVVVQLYQHEIEVDGLHRDWKVGGLV